MSKYLLEVKKITKSFPGVVALKSVSMQVRAGEIHAICGENGAGKSTLIKILSGIYPYGEYEGEMKFEGEPITFSNVREVEDKGISTIFQELSLVKSLSVAENLFIGNWPNKRGLVDWNQIYDTTKKLLEDIGLKINPRDKVESLGIGQQQLVEIAKAISKESKLIIFDEPTSALCDNEIDILFDIIKQLQVKGIACIYISHKLDEVFRIADNITVLRDGEYICTKPVKELDHQKLIYYMVGRELANSFPRESQEQQELLLKIENWSLFYDKSRQQKIVKDVNLEVYKGEILGIAGLMGAGRTELASSLFGIFPGMTQGTMYVGGEIVQFRHPQDAISKGLAYLSEDRKRYGLVLGMKVSENITLANLKKLFGSIIKYDKEKEKALSYIKKMKIKTPSEQQLVKNLSGGNQQKVVISKWLETNPKILIVDEVTRGIDVGAKFEFYKILNELMKEGLAIVMISSELPELLGICNRIVVMHEGRITGNFKHTEATQEKIMACAMQ